MPMYEYHCPDCGLVKEHLYKYEERPETVPCEGCTGTAEYHVGKPAYFRIKFDQNGRIAYKNDMGNGKQTFRSATKENYEHNLGNRGAKSLKEMGEEKNKSIYTKEYGRVKEKQEKEKTVKLKKAFKAIQEG